MTTVTVAETDSLVHPCHNGGDLRSKEAGTASFSKVKTHVTLESLLESFDKKRHGGEAMAFPPSGKEREGEAHRLGATFPASRRKALERRNAI